MQHSINFNLNLIDKDDTFSPDPVSENTTSVDESMKMAYVGMRGEHDQRTRETAALDQRVTALEAKKMVLGSYKGTGSNGIGSQIIELGFSPIALIVCGSGQTGLVLRDSQNAQLKLTETGFVAYNSSGVHFNNYPSTYNYIAFT